MVEEFALKVFAKADNEDRVTTPTKKTAVTFLAASIFMEVLRVFSAEGGELDDEIEEKIKYAKWKAADIMKSLREGKIPISGPPGGSNDAEVSAQTNAQNDQDMATSPNTSQPSMPMPKSPTVVQSIQPPAPVPQPAVFQPVQTSAPGVFLDPALSEQAQKFCRYAISSLQYDDVNSALDNLEKAAALLRPFKK
jgi:vacuolar protein sorting-associated protein VTA1